MISIELKLKEDDQPREIVYLHDDRSNERRKEGRHLFNRKAGQGMIAAAIYFVELKIWLLRNDGKVKGFRFKGEAEDSPVKSLGSQINSGTWIKPCFSNDHDLIFPNIQYRHGDVPEKELRVIGFKTDLQEEFTLKVCRTRSGGKELEVLEINELVKLRAALFSKGPKWNPRAQPYTLPEKIKNRLPGGVEDYSPENPLDIAGATGSKFVPTDRHTHCSLFATGDDPNDLAPTFSEYTTGGVAKRDKEQEILATLKQDGMCYVEGFAGSGKTTMALRLACVGPNFRQTFYLDMQDPQVVAEAWGRKLACRLLAWGDRLVIADNCDRNPNAVHKLVDALDLARGHVGDDEYARLLMLGRPFDEGINREQHPLSRRIQKRVDLNPVTDEVERIAEAIASRFAKRRMISGTRKFNSATVDPFAFSGNLSQLAEALKQ